MYININKNNNFEVDEITRDEKVIYFQSVKRDGVIKLGIPVKFRYNRGAKNICYFSQSTSIWLPLRNAKLTNNILYSYTIYDSKMKKYIVDEIESTLEDKNVVLKQYIDSHKRCMIYLFGTEGIKDLYIEKW